MWVRTNRADPLAAALADRHYSRQKPGTRQFVQPGRCLVLVTPDYDALWVTSWPYEQYVLRKLYPGAWTCSLFRNEGEILSSDLIRAAIVETIAYFGDPPEHGFITTVRPDKVRHKRDPGRCFRKVGFQPIGFTADGKQIVFHLSAAQVRTFAPYFTHRKG
jgi:hypothetical protein